MSNATPILPNNHEGYHQLRLLAAFQQMDSADVRLLYVAEGSGGSGQVEFWLRSPTTPKGKEEHFTCLGCALRAIYERGFLVLLQVPHAHYFFNHFVASVVVGEPPQPSTTMQKSLPQLLVMFQRELLQARQALEHMSRLSPETARTIEQEYVVDRDLAAFVAARDPSANEQPGDVKTLIDALCRVMNTIFEFANRND